MLKNGQKLVDHETQKSAVYHQWFDELTRFID